MVSLGQQLKMPKTCEKPLSENIRVILCKKPFEKTPNIREMTQFFKIGHLAKVIAHAKAIAFAKWSVWVKNQKCQKHAKNNFTRTLELFCAKNGSKKHQIFDKWDNFENRPSSRGYSLCKMFSLGQKLKLPKTCQKPFFKKSRVVLCKKTFEKNPNIREIRRFWKPAILQRL